MECEPDVIFIGGRLSASYDTLSEIAPVIYLSTDAEIGLVESVIKNATTIASLFGLESEIEEKTSDFAERITALQAVADGKTALIGMTTSGSFNLLGNDGRCSIIGGEIGFNNLTASGTGDAQIEKNTEEQNSQEKKDMGNLIMRVRHMEMNPPLKQLWQKIQIIFFVMDRDSAIGTEVRSWHRNYGK